MFPSKGSSFQSVLDQIGFDLDCLQICISGDREKLAHVINQNKDNKQPSALAQTVKIFRQLNFKAL